MEIRQLEQRISGQLLLGRRSDVTDGMRCRSAERIMPGKSLFNRNAGQFRHGNLDPSHFVPTQIRSDHDRDERVLAPDLTQNPVAVRVAEFD